MRRTHSILLTLALGTLLSEPAFAQSGGPLDARSIRPAVILMVDTSGSMERIPDDGTNPNCDNCVPTCTGNTLLDRNNKTRWALTIEALTGTIDNYQCQSLDRSTSSTITSSDYDYGYYLPHIDFSQNLTQSSDGILDSFASRVKFGLMTFDGVGTTLGGDTLVPLSQWYPANGTFATAANGAPGMFSYGEVGRLAFPGCVTDYGINAGARGPGTDPGSLVGVGVNDDIDSITRVNQSIQASLLQVRPFGGTPIPAMLDDLRFYLANGTDINPTGDSLYECRQRKAILITDGAPDAMFRDTRFNCGIDEQSDPTVHSASCTAPNSHPTTEFSNTGCSCPYKKPEELAHDLLGGPLTDLIVVAYNVHDASALATLELIGNALNRGAVRDQASTYPHIVQADGAGELRSKLDQLLNASQPGVTSRSVPVSVSVGDLRTAGSTKRFDITAGFQVGRNTAEPWQGLLYRGRSECHGTAVSEESFSTASGDVFHESLTQQTASNQRAILTATPTTYGPVNGSLINTRYVPVPVQSTDTYSPSSYTADPNNYRQPDGRLFGSSDMVTAPPPAPTQGAVTTALDLPDVTNPNFVDRTSLDSNYFGDADNDRSYGTTADRTAVVNYVYGRGRTNALADIYHSQPVVLFPINHANESRLASIDSRYTSWLRALTSGGSTGHYDTDGRPGVVFVGTNDGLLHAFNLDTWRNHGTTYEGGHEFWSFAPAALFGTMASMIGGHQTGFDGSPEVKDVVLKRAPGVEPLFRTILVSALRGAPAFIALDVTYPETPVFLWQKSFPDLGNTVGNVGLTQVNVTWGSEEEVRAVAILPGGQGEACATDTPVAPRADKTRAQFPTGGSRSVRCWNRRGRGLYVVDVASGETIQQFGPEHFPSPLTGAIAVDNNGTGPASAAYFFDHDGILWRLSMLSADPHNWKAAPIYDMFDDPVLNDPTNTYSWQAGRHPLYAPTLTRDRDGNLVILAGTGDPDSPRDVASHRVVSLTEVRELPQDGEIAAQIKLNWRIELNPNEAVTGPLTVFQNVVYFGSFESGPGSGQCSYGTSRLWGAHAFEAVDPQAVTPLPKPGLQRANSTTPNDFVLANVYTNSGLILGATIKQQPICQGSAGVYNAATQQYVPNSAPGGGAFQLSGVMAGGSSGGTTRGGNVTQGAISETVPQNIQVQTNTKVTSWASMFE